MAEKLKPNELLVLFLRGYLEVLRGNRARALELVKSIRALRIGEDSVQFVGCNYYALGDFDTLFERLERGLELHALDGVNLMYNPLFANARTDPRYESLIGKFRVAFGFAK